ncbi:NAD-dependent epimerase/dehydratase family protein [Actinocorallia populi]|uniref:NAD-dependent epimerase/dehydratase family protein n=1 Tax=Actinocorallia populi TaxID=2079200 RepID=UPI000D08E59D|nr:NAD(P)-dependent oxidoreductase [Actinocorallia populi]
MRLLLFGATGFLGRHVAARAAGHDVVAVSRRPGAADLWLDPAEDPAGAAEALRLVRPDVVVNCGGSVDGTPAELVEGNVTAVSRLVEAVRDRGCRLVHVGSAAEYGPVPEGVPVAETTCPQPAGIYGVTKLAGTALALTLPDAVVMRVFNPIGPGAPPASLLGSALAQVTSGSREIRTGPLDTTRDYVDVRDVADAILAAAESTAHGVLNVGSGRPTSSRTLLHTLLSLLPGRTLAETSEGSPRSPSVPWQQADLTTTTTTLPWKPTTPLPTTLRDLLREAGC